MRKVGRMIDMTRELEKNDMIFAELLFKKMVQEDDLLLARFFSMDSLDLLLYETAFFGSVSTRDRLKTEYSTFIQEIRENDLYSFRELVLFKIAFLHEFRGRRYSPGALSDDLYRRRSREVYNSREALSTFFYKSRSGGAHGVDRWLSVLSEIDALFSDDCTTFDESRILKSGSSLYFEEDLRSLKRLESAGEEVIRGLLNWVLRSFPLNSYEEIREFLSFLRLFSIHSYNAETLNLRGFPLLQRQLIGSGEFFAELLMKRELLSSFSFKDLLILFLSIEDNTLWIRRERLIEDLPLFSSAKNILRELIGKREFIELLEYIISGGNQQPRLREWEEEGLDELLTFMPPSIVHSYMISSEDSSQPLHLHRSRRVNDVLRLLRDRSDSL